MPGSAVAGIREGNTHYTLMYACLQVSIAGMEVLVILAGRMKDRFRPYISTGMSLSLLISYINSLSLSLSPLSFSVFPPLRERLGDSKEQVREVAQQLTQKIMVDVVSSPQQFLDKLANTCVHVCSTDVQCSLPIWAPIDQR